MDGRRGDKIADLAAHVRTLALDFFDGFQHASVFFALHVRLVDDPRVEFEVANLAGEMALVGGVDVAELSLLPRLPLLLLDRLVGWNRAEGTRGQKGIEAGLFQLLDVGFPRQMGVEDPA